MNKKVIVLVFIFIVGFIGGLLLSKAVGNKKDAGKNNNYNSNTNIVATNNTSNTNNEINNNTTNNAVIDSSTNTSKTDNKAQQNQASSSTTTNNKTENTQSGLAAYKAIWQYPDSTYPEKEFEVKNISDTKVVFDYSIDGITTFENASATINGNVAKFDIKNDGDWNIKGTITFENNTVVFKIEESSTENIPVESTTFKVKSNKSAF